MFKKKQMAVLLGALALGLAAPVSAAHADSYSPGTNNQYFSTSPGGWTSAATTTGLCLPGLLCPTATNGFVGSGGATGDGYIRTQFTSVASTVAGTSTGTWNSPSFAYGGNKGKTPKTVALNLDIRPQLSALLGLSVLNDSSYQVDLVDQNSGAVVSAIPSTTLTTDSSWTAVPSAAIAPSLLTIGESYQIRITTTYHSTVSVLASGEVGYDNVRLVTHGKAGRGHHGHDGTNGGSGITSISQLRTLVLSQGLPRSAKVVGNRLRVKVSCPKVAATASCRYALQGLSKARGSKAATGRKVFTVKAGHSRTVRLVIKPKFRKKFHHGHRITVRAKVRVGHLSVTVFKRLRVTR